MSVQKQQTNPASVVFPILADYGAILPPEQDPRTGKPTRRRLTALLILIAGAAVPSWFAAVTAHRPQTRDIHIEAYRYGFSPSRIHANRFENDGRGNFKSHLIWGSTNEDYGSSGIRLVDLNQDGKVDILYTNGDAFDYLPPRPRPWHSVQWLENKGNFKFEHHAIGLFPGASAAVAADLGGDGDLDVAAVSCYNFWERPDSQSIIWYENHGKMNFTQHDISHSPTHLISLEAADMNGDGKPDLVSVRMDVYQPFTNDGRVVLWLNHWGQPPPKLGGLFPFPLAEFLRRPFP
jgi:hypothetical protein